MKVARRVAKSIMDRQVESYATGEEGGKDVMSILGQSPWALTSCEDLNSIVEPVRANLSEDPKRKLSEDEILSQLT